MAQKPPNKRPGNSAGGQPGKRPQGKAGGAGAGPGTGPGTGKGTGTGKGGAAAAKGRQSVAAARRTKAGSNRTQLIIGGIAVALIAAVVVVGIVLNRQQTAVQGGGYGTSKSSTATAADGIITFTNGTPKTSIDVFEDALCPICAEFEAQFGQQLAQAVDQGTLTVRLRMLNFLDKNSASKDYSTRAYAAVLAVVHDAGSTPGLAMKFHSALFDPTHQPKEGGSSDLTNDQLGDLAVSVGAPATVKTDIVAGKYVAEATTGAQASTAALQAATGRIGTPTVLNNNSPVAINSADWLTNLLGTS